MSIQNARITIDTFIAEERKGWHLSYLASRAGCTEQEAADAVEQAIRDGVLVPQYNFSCPTEGMTLVCYNDTADIPEQTALVECFECGEHELRDCHQQTAYTTPGTRYYGLARVTA